MMYDIATADIAYHATTERFQPTIQSSIGQMTSTSPADDWVRMIGRRWAESIFPSTIATTPTKISVPIDTSWFKDALETLAQAEIEAEDDEERLATLEMAEHLIAHFAAWPPPLRPRFSIDVLDRPSFSSKSDRHYLHATVDTDLGLHWYAEVDGEEVPVSDSDNRETLRAQLPNDLLSILRAY